MTLTPFMILILAAFAVFIGVLGVVSIWSKGGPRRTAVAKVEPAEGPSARTSPTLSA